MKSIFVSFFSIFFLLGQSNAQTVLETPLFNKVEIDGRLLYHRDNVSCYLGSSTGPKSGPLYSFLNYETGKIETRECEELDSKNGTGSVLAASAKEDYFYELIEYGGTGFTTKCYVGMVKRDNSTMKIVATYDLGEFGIFNSEMLPNISMYRADDGIFLVAGRQGYGEQRNFISKVDFDLNLLWHNDFDYFSEDGVSLGKSVVQGNNLITEMRVEVATEKKFSFFAQPMKSGLILLAHNSKGESDLIVPTLNEDHIVLGSKFFYNEEKMEYTGFFLTIKKYVGNMNEDRHGVGYALYRWDSEGKVKQATIEYFSLEDLTSNGNLEKFMEAAELELAVLTRENDLKGLLRINQTDFKVDFLENGEIIVRVDGYNIGELKKGMKYADVDNSFFLFSLNADGSKKWVQFYPASSHQHGATASHIRGDRMFIYGSDYVDNFTNGEYKLNNVTGLSTWKTIIPVVRSVNLNNGSTDYYEPITTEVYKDLELRLTEINRYDDSQSGVLVTHSDFKMVNWKSRLYIPR